MSLFSIRSGRRAFHTGRSQSGSAGGLYGSENAGISSESMVRIHAIESLRFPGEGSSAQGKPGAKARPRGVVDAQTVDIPLPSKDLSKGTLGKRMTRAMVAPGVRD